MSILLTAKKPLHRPRFPYQQGSAMERARRKLHSERMINPRIAGHIPRQHSVIESVLQNLIGIKLLESQRPNPRRCLAKTGSGFIQHSRGSAG